GPGKSGPPSPPGCGCPGESPGCPRKKADSSNCPCNPLPTNLKKQNIDQIKNPLWHRPPACAAQAGSLCHQNAFILTYFFPGCRDDEASKKKPAPRKEPAFIIND